MRSIKIALALVFLGLLTGCVRPYNRPAVVQIETNETAFLVDMRSDGSASTDVMTKIQRKDVLVDGYWVQTGRFHNSGYWRPSQKVLVVSRKPVEVKWSENSSDPTVRAVSSESVGFRIPLVINATIQSDEDAAAYLKWFKSNRAGGNTRWERIDDATIQSDEDAAAYLKWFKSNRAGGDTRWEGIDASEWPIREEAEPLGSFFRW